MGSLIKQVSLEHYTPAKARKDVLVERLRLAAADLDAGHNQMALAALRRIISEIESGARGQ